MSPRHSDPITFDSGLVALAFRALREPRSRYPFLERLISGRRKRQMRVGGVILKPSPSDSHYLVVVRRGETELLKTLRREFRQAPNVRIIWDRRSQERRATEDKAPGAERRRRDRRSRPPAVWDVGYLLVRSRS
jgi:hypothetical protein